MKNIFILAIAIIGLAACTNTTETTKETPVQPVAAPDSTTVQDTTATDTTSGRGIIVNETPVKPIYNPAL